MKQSSFAFEKILWSAGAVIMLAAVVLALTSYWRDLSILQKYGLIVLPVLAVYGYALVLSFRQKYAYLQVCLYIIVGLAGPIACSILLQRHGLFLALASLFLMLIPAVFKPQKTVQVFCMIYVIWAYFAIVPFFPESGAAWQGMVQKMALGLALWGLPWILPQSWRRVAEDWGRPLGALFLLLGATAGLFDSQYPAWLDWLDVPIGLAVLIFGTWAHSRLMIIELVFFYVLNVLELSAKYFNHFQSWPMILMMVGAGLIVFGVIYLIIHKRLDARKRLTL